MRKKAEEKDFGDVEVMIRSKLERLNGRQHIVC